ncbi:MAG: hypothetical protein K8F59_13420 [Rhodobacteraceae bacterium]|nr:hypothetical protein [Paracoccaceae bacterium]MCB1366249.1 hypothetical protein [Paracoccaceae bacterium]
MAGLQNLYFRVRDNGAAVFRVDTENRQRRLDLEQIAIANTNNGQIKPHGDAPPTPDEMAEIEAWMAARKQVLEDRAIDDIFRAIDYLNLTAHWAQTKASDEDLEQFTDALLMAMHDLRAVLVRKKSDRLLKND